jgi:hypothetical protein
MSVTLNDLTPVSLCVVTEELFDAKRFLRHFCDNILLRDRDQQLEPTIISFKRELNSPVTQKKFFDGYKAILLSNLDKIISLVSGRYSKIDLKTVERIVKEGKALIQKILLANNFLDIADLYPTFRSKIYLPTYQLFLASMEK